MTTIAPLSILGIPALATAQEIVAQKIDCKKALTTPEMKYCSQQSYQAADRQLNQVYQKVISNLNGEQKEILTAAQQTWIKFRDRNYDFEVYGNRGGTGYEIFRNGCLERLTTQRTKDLQNYLSSR
jgi:uncharacterized protein YecT (DUF1311 family)